MRGLPALLITMLALVLGCGGEPSECRAFALPAEHAPRMDEARAALGFEPVMPCATGSAMRLDTVSLDRPDGSPRLTFAVRADDAPLFLFSQSRSVRRFTQIPDGASTLAWAIGGASVRGFEQPAGAGPALLYLRWERAGVVYEFQANPSTRFPVATLRTLARLHVERTLTVAADSTSLSGD